MKRRWVRWLPAAVVPAVIGAGVLIAPLAAGAADLPAKSPQEVLALVSSSDSRAFSGTIEQTSDLGLPTLPSTSPGSGDVAGSGSNGGADASSALELLTGSHKAQVAVDGPTKVRVQVLDQLAERDVVRNGDDVWLYASKGQQVTHVTLPSADAADPDAAVPDASSLTPSALAQRFLSAVDPSAAVTLGADTKVAGRDAYDLVLTPRTAATLVGSVSIAVDGSTGIPLRVQVEARGQKNPAVEVEFSSFSADTPSASRFEFTPPSGATVTEKKLSAGDADGARAEVRAHPRPAVTGSGWDAIVTLPAGTASGDITSSPLFGQLTTAVDGGRALSTALVSVLITDDGRVLAGAVPVSALQAVAAQ
ncbi:outer membrane lipoprotein carrier protein LolA [Leifsonia sp. NPDC058292]|uniref:LolA family protein n=1 Tax=Leifsonia sp. NPDC058292 TaxID=3346428 RepID=UPI0036DA0F61